MKLSSLPLLLGIWVTLGQAQWTPLGIPANETVAQPAWGSQRTLIAQSLPSIPAKLEFGATWKYQNTWSRGLAVWGSFVRDIRLTPGNDITPWVFAIRDSGTCWDSSKTEERWMMVTGVRSYQVRCGFSSSGLDCDDPPNFGFLGAAHLFARRPLKETYVGWFFHDEKRFEATVDRVERGVYDTSEVNVFHDSLGMVSAHFRGGGGSHNPISEYADLLQYKGKPVIFRAEYVGIRDRLAKAIRPGLRSGSFDALGRSLRLPADIRSSIPRYLVRP